MGKPSDADLSAAGMPVSVEAAFRRVRLLVGALMLVRLWTAGSLPHVGGGTARSPASGRSTASRTSPNARRPDPGAARHRAVAGRHASSCCSSRGPSTATDMGSADWAVLVLPAIEGAIRFRVAGAGASWLVLAGGYCGREHGHDAEHPRGHDRPAADGRAARRAPRRIPRRAARLRDRRPPGGPQAGRAAVDAAAHLRARRPHDLAPRRRRDRRRDLHDRLRARLRRPARSSSSRGTRVRRDRSVALDVPRPRAWLPARTRDRIPAANASSPPRPPASRD